MPDWPTPRQIDELHAASMPAVRAQVTDTESGALRLRERLEPFGFMLIEVEGV